MRRLLPFLLCVSAFAQTNGGHVTIGGHTTLGIRSSLASDLMGLAEFNDFDSPSNNNLIAMQFVDSQFQQKTAITHPEADGCSVVYNSKIYVIGGYSTDASTPLNYVQIYDPSNDTWTQGATITTAAWGMGCAQVGGVIYAFGGVISSAETPRTNAYAYNIAGNSWSTLTSLPTAVPDGLMAVAVGTNVYLLLDNHFWQYDTLGNSYTSLTTPPGAVQLRWSATGYVNVSGDDRVYFIGGCSTPGPVCVATNYYWSVTNSTWSGAQTSAPYAARGLVQNNVNSSLIYYVGGFDQTIFRDQLYSYNPATDTWSSLIANMNAFRDGVAGGWVSGKLFVIGGRNSSTAPFGMGVNESYELGTVPSVRTFTKIQLNYNTGAPSGNVRLGVYSDSSGVPGTLLLDAGQVAVANGWVAITGLSLALTPGTRYWLVYDQSAVVAISFTNGAPKNPNGAGTAHCIASQAFGALPSTYPASPSCLNNTMYAEKLTVN